MTVDTEDMQSEIAAVEKAMADLHSVKYRLNGSVRIQDHALADYLLELADATAHGLAALRNGLVAISAERGEMRNLLELAVSDRLDCAGAERAEALIARKD
jgi:hypothetical protein